MCRYIDADELANKLNDLLKDIDRDIDKARAKSKIYSKKFIEGSALQQMGIACALQDVLDAPTIDVVERKKGEWIFNPSDAIDMMFIKPRCSECGFESADVGNYCSKCGSYMRKEVK